MTPGMLNDDPYLQICMIIRGLLNSNVFFNTMRDHLQFVLDHHDVGRTYNFNNLVFYTIHFNHYGS